jgi:hypothetical protein
VDNLSVRPIDFSTATSSLKAAKKESLQGLPTDALLCSHSEVTMPLAELEPFTRGIAAITEEPDLIRSPLVQPSNPHPVKMKLIASQLADESDLDQPDTHLSIEHPLLLRHGFLAPKI